MHTITLVCSVHKSNGNCDVGQLVKILRKLEPDVIFQEVRSSDGQSLEALAAREYCEFKLCRLVHVDEHKLPVDAAEIKFLLDVGLEYVAECCEEYRELESENLTRTDQDGFNYLNSVDFAKTSARMERIEDELMEGKAADALRRWRQFMLERDIEMVRNIYSHCKTNAFDTGVFLVGAGHRMGIAKQIQNFSAKEPDLIAWNFYDGRILST